MSGTFLATRSVRKTVCTMGRGSRSTALPGFGERDLHHKAVFEYFSQRPKGSSGHRHPRGRRLGEAGSVSGSPSPKSQLSLGEQPRSRHIPAGELAAPPPQEAWICIRPTEADLGQAHIARCAGSLIVTRASGRKARFIPSALDSSVNCDSKSRRPASPMAALALPSRWSSTRAAAKGPSVADLAQARSPIRLDDFPNGRNVKTDHGQVHCHRFYHSSRHALEQGGGDVDVRSGKEVGHVVPVAK